MEELETVEQKKLLAKRLEELIVNRGLTLSTSTADEVMEKLARHFLAEIKQKKLYDVKQGKEEMAYHIISAR